MMAKGSHGSITKAGKVRFGRNKYQKKFHKKTKRRPVSRTGRRANALQAGGLVIPSSLRNKSWRAIPVERTYKKKRVPRLSNKRKYIKRVLEGKQAGQQRRVERWQK